jgi:hypothetical protein
MFAKVGVEEVTIADLKPRVTSRHVGVFYFSNLIRKTAHNFFTGTSRGART